MSKIYSIISILYLIHMFKNSPMTKVRLRLLVFNFCAVVTATTTLIRFVVESPETPIISRQVSLNSYPDLSPNANADPGFNSRLTLTHMQVVVIPDHDDWSRYTPLNPNPTLPSLP